VESYWRVRVPEINGLEEQMVSPNRAEMVEPVGSLWPSNHGFIPEMTTYTSANPPATYPETGVVLTLHHPVAVRVPVNGNLPPVGVLDWLMTTVTVKALAGTGGVDALNVPV
jgi:hypothetical protein